MRSLRRPQAGAARPNTSAEMAMIEVICSSPRATSRPSGARMANTRDWPIAVVIRATISTVIWWRLIGSGTFDVSVAAGWAPDGGCVAPIQPQCPRNRAMGPIIGIYSGKAIAPLNPAFRGPRPAACSARHNNHCRSVWTVRGSSPTIGRQISQARPAHRAPCIPVNNQS